ncbi:MAG: UDP-2,3-diacylglucosamine diphosphatase [Gammaproteobacteria bacterium]|nr:UDP-2,3-diacylglucosamine diphosphatase [Gammaproteobacteria bacterium]
MPTTFISDLHLSTERPEMNELFLDFLDKEATKADALYILGDLFEVWIGDDASVAEHDRVIKGLLRLTTSGTPVYVMHGNRDFLMGGGFEQASGCKLIPDPTIITLYGVPTLLMHGDTLCTDDVEYQRFRAQVHDPRWQQQMLALPAEQRAAIAKDYRAQSREQSRQKAEEIMDVNQQAVEQALREHGVNHLIHGHTHRPGIHDFTLDGKPARRTVLGDWYQRGSALTCASSGCWLQPYPLPR